VIPVYNAEAYIEDTFSSLQNQTYKNFEVIAVNDGSTDRSEQLLQKFSSFAEIVNQSNAGQAAAMNRGWSRARGQWLGYLSADDRLKPNALAQLSQNISQNPSAIGFYPDYDLIDDKGRNLKSVRAPDFEYKKVVGELLCPPGPGVLIHRRIFEKFGGWRTDLRQMPDYEYWLRIGGQGDLIHVQQCLADFRVHPSSQSFAASSIEKSEEPVKILNDFYSQSNMQDDVLNLKCKAMGFAHLLSARLHWRSHRPFYGLRHYLQGVRSWPPLMIHPRAAGLIVNATVGTVTHRLRQLLSSSR